MSQISADDRAIGAIRWNYNTHGYFCVGRVLPTGRVYIQAEMAFKYQPVPDVVKQIRNLLCDLDAPDLSGVYADADLFDRQQEDETAIHVEPIADIFARNGQPLTAIKGNITHGWQRIHDYLRDAPDGKPWLIVSPKCPTMTGTIPSLVQTKTDPDDVDRTGPSHAAHALRCLLSSRPSPSAAIFNAKRYPWGTVGWLRQLDARENAPRGVLSRGR